MILLFIKKEGQYTVPCYNALIPKCVHYKRKACCVDLLKQNLEVSLSSTLTKVSPPIELLFHFSQIKVSSIAFRDRTRSRQYL